MSGMAQKIVAALEKQGELTLSVVVAEIEYAEGLTKVKITEYLETLEKLGRFALDEEQDKIKKAS